MELPSACDTGFEKVRVIGVSGPIVLPGEGFATAPAAAPAGNQLTTDGGEVSHVRGAPPTSIEPACEMRSSVTSLCAVRSTRRWICPGWP